MAAARKSTVANNTNIQLVTLQKDLEFLSAELSKYGEKADKMLELLGAIKETSTTDYLTLKHGLEALETSLAEKARQIDVLQGQLEAEKKINVTQICEIDQLRGQLHSTESTIRDLQIQLIGITTKAPDTKPGGPFKMEFKYLLTLFFTVCVGIGVVLGTIGVVLFKVFGIGF